MDHEEDIVGEVDVDDVAEEPKLGYMLPQDSLYLGVTQVAVIGH